MSESADVFTARPDTEEYAAFFAGYVGLVPAGDVRIHLQTQLHETIALFSGLSEEQGAYAYAPGKWTLKQVLNHMADAERVFGYRMVCIARGDETPLPPFDENQWMPNSGANERTVASLVLEFAAIRASTVQLVASLTTQAFLRRGTASGKTVSVRALAFVCAGHERHHLKVVRERYLKV